MYNQNYKVELPQFPDREVSIAEYGAKSGDLQIETGRHNAEAINRAICEVSEQGGGTVRVPAGICPIAVTQKTAMTINKIPMALRCFL